MSNSRYAAPVAISLGIHLALFFPLAPEPAATVRPETERTSTPPEPERTKREVRAAALPIELLRTAAAPEDAAPNPAPPKARKETPPRPSPPRAPTQSLREVVKPRDQTLRCPGPGDWKPPGDEKGFPELVICWSDSEQVLDVARAVGIKVVGLGPDDTIVGELSDDGSRVDAWKGSLEEYSTRVRTLSRELFRPRAPLLAQPVRLWALLVPWQVDSDIVSHTREALEERGLQPSEVRSIEGRFVRDDGSWQFVVTKLVEE